MEVRRGMIAEIQALAPASPNWMARDLRNNPRTPPLVPILLKEQREQMEFLETQRHLNFRALCGDNNIINSSRQRNQQQANNNNSKIVDKFAQALGNPNAVPASGGNLLAVPQRPQKNNLMDSNQNDQQSQQLMVSVQVHVNGSNMTFNNSQQQPSSLSPSRRRDQTQKANILFDRFQLPKINVEQPEPRSVHSLQVPTFGQGKQQQSSRQRAISDGVESSPSAIQDNQQQQRPKNLFQNRNSANQPRRAAAGNASKRNGQSSNRGGGNVRGSNRDYNFDNITSGSSSSEDGQHINPMLWRRPPESNRHKPSGSMRQRPSSSNQRRHQYHMQSSSLTPQNRPQGIPIESGPFNPSIPSQVNTPIFAKQESPPLFVELPLINQQFSADNTFFQMSSEHLNNPQSFHNQLAQQVQQQAQQQQNAAIQVMPLQQQPQQQQLLNNSLSQPHNTVAVSAMQQQQQPLHQIQEQSQIERASSQQGNSGHQRGLQRQQSMFGNYSGSLESLIDKLQVWSQGSSKEKSQSLLSGYLLNSMLICLSMILFAVYFLVSSDPSSQGEESLFTPAYAMVPLTIIELRSGWLQFQRILTLKRTEHSLVDQVNKLVQFQENEESAIVKELIRKKSWTLIVEQFKNLIESSCRILLYLTVTIIYYQKESEMGGYTLAAMWLCLGLIQRLLWIRFIRNELNTYSKIACLVLKLLLVVQMVNIGLRLDKHIEWRWEAVMWPVYIILSLAMVCSVSSTLLCIGQVFTAIFRGQSAENFEDHQRRRRLRAQGIEDVKPQQFQFCFSFWAFYMVNGFTISSLLSLLKFLKLMNAASEGDMSELYSGFLAGLFPAIYLLGVIVLTLMNFNRIKYWIADHVFKEKAGGLQLIPGNEQMSQTRRRFLGPLEVERRRALENSEDRHSHHHHSSSGRHTISSSESISSSDEENNEDSRSEPSSESTIPGEFDDMPRFMMLVSTGSGAYFKTLKDFLFRGYGGILGTRRHSHQSGSTTVKSKPLKLDIAGKVIPDLHLSAIKEQVEERMEMDEESAFKDKDCTSSMKELMNNKLNQSQEQGDPGQRTKTQKKRVRSIAKRFQINAKRLRELQKLETSSAKQAAAAKIGPLSLTGSQASYRCQKQGNKIDDYQPYNYSHYEYAGFNYSDDDASKASNALGSSLFAQDGKTSGKEKSSMYPQHQYTDMVIKKGERQQSGAQQSGIQSGQDTQQLKQQYTSQMMSKVALLKDLNQQYDTKNGPEEKGKVLESFQQLHQKIEWQVNTGEVGFISKNMKKTKKHVVFGRRNSLDEEDLKLKKQNDPDKLHPKLLLDVNIEMLKSQRRQLKRLEEEVKKVASIKDLLRLECLICLTATADAVIMPCGHGGLCFDCGQSLCASTDCSNRSIRCHLCRKRIHSILQLDLAIFQQDRRNTMSLPGSGGSALMIPVLRYLDLRDPTQPQIKNVKDEQRRINLSTRKNNESDLTYKHNQQNTSLLRVFQPPDDIMGVMNKDLESLPPVDEGTNHSVNSGMMVIGIDIRNNYAVFQQAEIKNNSRKFARGNLKYTEDAEKDILNLCNIELVPAESPFPHQSHLNSSALENSLDFIRPETRSNNYLPQRANIGRCLQLLSPKGEDSDDNRFNNSNTTHSIEDVSCNV